MKLHNLYRLRSQILRELESAILNISHWPRDFRAKAIERSRAELAKVEQQIAELRSASDEKPEPFQQKD